MNWLKVKPKWEQKKKKKTIIILEFSTGKYTNITGKAITPTGKTWHEMLKTAS